MPLLSPPMDSAAASGTRRFDHLFRWRCKEVSRVEAIADAVFGLVMAMLLLRERVPESFAALTETTKSLLPFAVTFAIIAMVWFQHFLFFRRYDLHDMGTILLTFVLLFLVVFYAYPLKLVFTYMAVMAFGPIGELTDASMRTGEFTNPLILYAIGCAAIYATLAAMYWNAWRQRADLALNAVETFLTRSSLVSCLVFVGVALLSLALALLHVGEQFGLPGWIYFLIGPAMTVHGTWQGRNLRRLGAA